MSRQSLGCSVLTGHPPEDGKSRTNCYWCPRWLKTNSGELVFALTADDFLLTDNGVSSKLTMCKVLWNVHCTMRLPTSTIAR